MIVDDVAESLEEADEFGGRGVAGAVGGAAEDPNTPIEGDGAGGTMCGFVVLVGRWLSGH